MRNAAVPAMVYRETGSPRSSHAQSSDKSSDKSTLLLWITEKRNRGIFFMDQTTRRFPAHAVIPRVTTARTPAGEAGSDVPPQSSAGRSVIAAATVNTERFISTASKRSISFF